MTAGRPVLFGQPYFFCPLQPGASNPGTPTGSDVRGSRDSLLSGTSAELSPNGGARGRDTSPGAIEKHTSRESLLR